MHTLYFFIYSSLRILKLLLWMLPQTQICKYLFASLYSMGWLIPMESLFLIFLRNCCTVYHSNCSISHTHWHHSIPISPESSIHYFRLWDCFVVCLSALSSIYPSGSERVSFASILLGNSLHIAAALWKLMDEKHYDCFVSLVCCFIQLIFARDY